ncbi:MAG: sensor histidine kinase [Culicoidibacterales bacterium]
MIESLLIRTLSLLLYIFLINAFFSNWSKNQKKQQKYNLYVLAILVISLITSFFVNEEISPYLNVVISIGTIFCIAKKHKLSRNEAIFWTVFLLTANIICEFIAFKSIYYLYSLGKVSVADYNFIVITTSTTLLLELIVVLLVENIYLQKNGRNQAVNLSILIILSLIPIISIAILFSILISEIKIEISANLMSFLTIFGVVTINICVLYLYNSVSINLKEKNRILLEKKALEAELRLFEQAEKNSKSIKKIKHDLRNQFLVVIGLLEKNESDKAKAYLQDSLNIIEVNDVFYTSDTVLNYILNEKIAVAQSKKIDMETKVFISKEIKLKNEVLTIIVGNLLDNALEACDRKKDMDRKISLNIRQYQNELVIDVVNTFDEKEVETRKNREVEGFGVANIHALVEENSGIYDYRYEKNKYYATVVLFNIY